MAYEIKVLPPAAAQFPKLMAAGECIVFVNEEKTGVILVGNKHFKAGEVYQDFDLANFKDYNESLIIKNA